ncbi:MAG: hypothetical protein L0H29_03875 [Sinobacteraceae bacterium]|nr:hypothetical protein [Nevskiaceae bacterium]
MMMQPFVPDSRQSRARLVILYAANVDPRYNNVMVNRPRLKRRNCVRLVLLAVLALLFQQTAFAAYACSVSAMPMATMVAGGAQAMSMPTQPTNGETVQPLCVQCCVQPVQATQSDQLPTVPPLQLAAIVPMQPVVLKLPAWPATRTRAAAERMPGLAPALKYRVLLI